MHLVKLGNNYANHINSWYSAVIMYDFKASFPTICVQIS